LHQIGHPGQGDGRIMAGDLPPGRQYLVTQAVAECEWVFIGGVQVIGDRLPGQVSQELLAPDAEQGADEWARHGRHAGESRQAAATAQMEQHGFGLIVQMMGQGDPYAGQIAAFSQPLPQTVGKKLVAAGTAGSFESQAGLAGKGGNINRPGNKFDRFAFTIGPHQGFIGITGAGPELVVEMGHPERKKVEPVQKMEQGHRIRTAGYPDENSAARRHQRLLLNREQDTVSQGGMIGGLRTAVVHWAPVRHPVRRTWCISATSSGGHCRSCPGGSWR